MSTPSRMTIAWDRLDQMALLPSDSSVVTPPPPTTIAWSPLLGPTIFDYDPSDFVVTPGANEETVTPPGGGGESGGGGGGDTGGGTTPGGGEPTPTHYGRPELTIAHRRGVKLFLEEGLFLHLHTTAPAHVRAVLQTKAKGKKGPAHLVRLSKILNAKVGGGDHKLTLHPSRGGRISLNKLKGSVSATLVVVVNYGNGQKPVQMRQHVSIVG